MQCIVHLAYWMCITHAVHTGFDKLWALDMHLAYSLPDLMCNLRNCSKWMCLLHIFCTNKLFTLYVHSSLCRILTRFALSMHSKILSTQYVHCENLPAVGAFYEIVHTAQCTMYNVSK